MQTLTSARNPLLKEIRKAALTGAVTSSGLCVAEGFHLLDEALRSGRKIEAVIAAETAEAAVRGRFPGAGAPRIFAIPEALFRGLSSTEAPRGVIALVRPAAWSMEDLLPAGALGVALDGVQDPGNAGAILRAAEAFGATGVAYLKGTVSPFNPKALRASAGSVFRVPLLRAANEDELLAACARAGVNLYALTPGADRDLTGCNLTRPCAFIVGSEGRGIRSSLRARAAAVRIPTLGVESLNAAMAAGVALYEARRQRAQR